MLKTIINDKSVFIDTTSLKIVNSAWLSRFASRRIVDTWGWGGGVENVRVTTPPIVEHYQREKKRGKKDSTILYSRRRDQGIISIMKQHCLNDLKISNIKPYILHSFLPS